MGINRDLLQWFVIFFDKKPPEANTSGGDITDANKSAINRKIMSNQQLAEKLQKPIIRKFEKLKVYFSFKDNICGAGLVHM